MHSWRLHLLPSLEQRSLYDAYRQDEPWDGPNNSTAVATPLEIFACPRDPPVTLGTPRTNYFAIVGPETAWPEDRGIILSEISDGPEQTIVVIEAAGLNVNWAEPRDLTFDDAIAILTSSADPFGGAHRKHPGYFYQGHDQFVSGVNVAFADGTAKFVPVPVPRDMAVALLTANAGDAVDMVAFRRLTEPQLDYGKITGLVAFVALALWPSVTNAWRRRAIATGSPATC